MTGTLQSAKTANGMEDKKVQTSLDNFTENKNGDANSNNPTNEENSRKKRKIESRDGDSVEDSSDKEEESRDEEELEHKPAHGTDQQEEKNAFSAVKADAPGPKESAKKEQDTKPSSASENNKSTTSDSRSTSIPSSILEKGIIYFFFRSRVNITSPHGIEDVARSYFVLRPLPLDAKIGSGPLEDRGDARLLALPKKMWPKSKSDKFLVFVDKAGAGLKDLREVLSGDEYSTKTAGTSQTQPTTPIAEGIYAITSTGRESHLAYQITIPTELSDVEKELGINQKGSFVCSVKNPEAPGPANATLDNPAKYPKELQSKFGGLRWSPLEPEHLNYEGTQMLIIGEGMGEFSGAVEEQSEDAKDDDKDKPEEEMEKLEKEDFDRVEALKEEDPVFADLGLSSKEWSHLQTTW